MKRACLATVLIASCQYPEGPDQVADPSDVDAPGRAPADTGGSPINGGGNAGAGVVPPSPWLATGAAGALPGTAFPAGQVDGATLYACRASYLGGLHGGRATAHGSCAFGYGGNEVDVASYDVLTGNDFTWRPMVGPLSVVPPQAMLSGYDAYGSQAFVCRAPYMGGVYPGKLFAGHCNIAVGGKELVLDTFDVLLKDASGKTIVGAN